MTATLTAACVHSQGLADMDARIEAATCPGPRRRAAWARLAADLPMDQLDAMTSEAGLADLLDLGGQILEGQIRGRTVIDGTSKRQARYVCITRKLAEWPFENGQTEKVGPSDGCRGNAVSLAAGSKYDFRELGAYLGNVG